MANPLFGHRMRDERVQELIIRSWQPRPPDPFIGGWQPLAPGKLPPSLIDVDNPPGYLPELLFFESADRTAYFRAQRWPSQKVIVSVDNPPVQDDERTALQTVIARSWDPQQPYPQQRRNKQLPVAAATATGDLSSTGTGTSAWVGTSQQNTAPKTLIQTHIVRAWDVPASIVQRRTMLPQVTATSATGAINSVGIATDIWTAASAATGAVSSAATGTAAWVGMAASNTVPKAAFQAHIIRSWNLQVSIVETGSLTQQFLGTSGALSADAVGTASFVGAATQPFLSRPLFQKHIIAAWDDSRILITAAAQQGIPAAVPKAALQLHIIRAWDVPASIQQRRIFTPQAIAAADGAISSQGAATTVWVGTSDQNRAPRIIIQNQIIGAWAPQQLILQPRRFLPQVPAAPGTGVLSSLGVGVANWIGAETAAAVLSAAGTATVRFVGSATSATSQRFDGWRPRHEILERRRRKDEQEIMAILAAVLPIVQSGTVSQPTRISVPRNGRTTLQ